LSTSSDFRRGRQGVLQEALFKGSGGQFESQTIGSDYFKNSSLDVWHTLDVAGDIDVGVQ